MSVGFTRRQAVCGGCAWAIAGCTSPGVPADGGNVTDDPGTTPPSDSGTTPPTDALPCDGVVAQPGSPAWFPLPLADYPDLAEVGGWYGIVVGGRNIVVAHVEDGCYVAIDRACTHEGELVNYNPSRGDYGQFVCPRHGAVYDLDGTRVSGPAPLDLPGHPAALDGDTVWVQLG
jgi:Rieske Fe-S protein